VGGEREMKRTISIALVLLLLFTSIGPVAATGRQKSLSRLDEEVKFRGTAIEYFSQIGAWGWNVSVDEIISGPSEILGHTVAAYLAALDPEQYPPGYMDPTIEPGDRVEVYGLYQGYDSVALFSSEDYYIVKTTVIEGIVYRRCPLPWDKERICPLPNGLFRE
jgi:hypothetical protein